MLICRTIKATIKADREITLPRFLGALVLRYLAGISLDILPSQCRPRPREDIHVSSPSFFLVFPRLLLIVSEDLITAVMQSTMLQYTIQCCSTDRVQW